MDKEKLKQAAKIGEEKADSLLRKIADNPFTLPIVIIIALCVFATIFRMIP